MSRHPELAAPSSASTLLRPFSLPYAVAARAKNFAYDRGWLQARRLIWPVISVGNLSVGGSGKTPVVLLLAELLSQRSWNVDVLSRGYGRSSKEIARVNPAGTAAQFGDEPLLMARRGLAVYVGADRYDPGQLAEQEALSEPTDSRRLHILDDGFQHRKLARDVDIVLLQRSDLEGRMLPAGRLREPLSGLQRASICVLRAEDADLSDRVLQRMGRQGETSDSSRLWIVERRTTLPPNATSHSSALAFCAIGDATGFFDGLKQVGLRLQSTIAFRDHYTCNRTDIARLKAVASRSGADCFVTTEKDGVRLSPALREELETQGPLLIAGLQLHLQNEKRCIDRLESLLQEHLQLHPHDVR
ncbi:MAG: tetraacyldisaccharide 4'-kinase [Acidobacteriota bacterium]